MNHIAAGARATARRVWPRRLGRTAVVLVGVLALGGCARGILQPQGPIADQDSKILLDAVGIMSAIVVPTMVASIAVAWWFRASNPRARFQPGFVYSGRLEIIIWSIPILVIMFLGGVIWIGAHELDPFTPLRSATKPLDIQVVAMDWKWLFIYPEDHIASVNSLVVPAGVPLHLSLTSATVMNAFFVPQLGSMVATMNGMRTQLYLEASHPGDYYGESSQYSGDGFSDMNFTLHAVPEAQFRKWVSDTQGAGPVLDHDGYIALSQESQRIPPFTYRDVAPHLFDNIVTLKLPPGPGPNTGRGGVKVSPRGGT